MKHEKRWISITDHERGLFNTASGNVIDLNNPGGSRFTLEDIATSLSNICRFGGQVSTFYSVAQHSFLVMGLSPLEIKREALMHDAAEAYLGDVVSPLKHILGSGYKALEYAFMVEICQWLGLSITRMKLYVKEYDLQALELEHQALQRDNPAELFYAMRKNSIPILKSYGELPCAWGPADAKEQFLMAARALFPGKE